MAFVNVATLLAEGVSLDGLTSRLSVFNMMEAVFAPAFPAALGKLVVVNLYEIERDREAGAGGADVERDRARSADLLLHVAGGGRRADVAVAERHDDGLQLTGFGARGRERAPRRLRRQVGGLLVVGGEAALDDAEVLLDPLVGGGHPGCDVGVRDHARRQMPPRAEDVRAPLRHQAHLSRGALDLAVHVAMSKWAASADRRRCRQR